MKKTYLIRDPRGTFIALRGDRLTYKQNTFQIVQEDNNQLEIVVGSFGYEYAVVDEDAIVRKDGNNNG